MHTLRWLVVAMVALAAVTAGAMTAATPAGGRSGLVVHEWGTFSSFSGADGVLLRFHPANTDLPPFVYHGGVNSKGEYSPLVSLETPVLYFYTDAPVTASIRAEFPEGAFTEWFPRADRSVQTNVLSWTGVRVRPDGPVHLPVAPGANHYYAARAADAAPLEVAFPKDGAQRREQEGFLFYRGVGDLTPPLSVTARGGGSFGLRATGKEAVAGLLLIEVRAGAVRFRQLGLLPGGTSATVDLPASWSTPGALRAALVVTLVRAGLYEKEARAMVATWEGAWFGDEGTRVLYVLSAGWTNTALPLRVTPQPEALVRVLVGRHDILSPEREHEIDGLVRQLKGGSAGEKTAAATALGKLGRFAPPARQRAEERLAGKP